MNDEQRNIIGLCRTRKTHVKEIAEHFEFAEQTVRNILAGVELRYAKGTKAKVWAKAREIAQEQQDLITKINL